MGNSLSISNDLVEVRVFNCIKGLSVLNLRHNKYYRP
jgi:hypothetical protein